MSYRLAALIVAVCIDVVFGDPPNALHPTAWMGSFIRLLSKHTPKDKRAGVQFLYGSVIVALGLSLTGIIGVGLARAIEGTGLPWEILLMGAVFKTTFTIRGLMKASQEISQALDVKDLVEARRLTAWHLVSRDTKRLNESELSAAVVESMAENTSDSIIAPWLYFFLFGLPGALMYRFANTADAMLGYRDEKHEWLGKAPARMDDLLNLIPARLTALLFIAATPFLCGDIQKAIRVWRRDHGLTSSPNAGNPMSAAAGVLGIRLEKVGHYTLGEGQRAAKPEDIKRMARLMVIASGIGVLLLAVIILGLCV
ncbi:MAG: adenosylcobinamide-phosphate synthase CbiB [Anaerolineales bacterium]|jgi:adenosylcobinamide-phosphate synthase